MTLFCRELSTEYPDKHEKLIQTISKFRDDEQEHHDTGKKYILRKKTGLKFGPVYQIQPTNNVDYDSAL